MADIIATEAHAKKVGESPLDVNYKKGCTQARAIELGCQNIGYDDNRLVPYNLLKKAETHQIVPNVTFYVGEEGLGVDYVYIVKPGGAIVTSQEIGGFPLVDVKNGVVYENQLKQYTKDVTLMNDNYYSYEGKWLFRLTVSVQGDITGAECYLPMNLNDWFDRNFDYSQLGIDLINQNLMVPFTEYDEEAGVSKANFEVSSVFPPSEINTYYLLPSRMSILIQN